MEQPRKKAVVLLSGGLDSATALAIAVNQGFDCHALTISYGQRHSIEIKAAGLVASQLGVREHRVIPLDLRAIGGSALTTEEITVPKDRTETELSSGIPITYVPARNTIFLAIALGWAEVIGSFDIFVGVNAVDYSGYPDCRPEFIAAFENLANLATKAGVEKVGTFRIHTPLMHMTKSEIIQKGSGLGVDFGSTHSCYDPDLSGLACGRCDACIIRRAGFSDAQVADPTRYSVDSR